MATIGQALTSPEAGWKRYDDNIPSFKYTNFTKISSASYYNGGMSETTSNQGVINFVFVGTKIRLIMFRNGNRSESVNITIDGVEESFSTNGSNTAMCLVYEKTGLTNGRHVVSIRNNTANAYTLSFDAIDIDSTGRLFHPDEVTNIKDLSIGKRIRCNYVATSGVVGTFNGLGQETADFIPPASSATPSGDFYYICVDKDHLGRWKLIADRNIQNAISWDKINESGIASGSGLPISFNNQVKEKFGFTTRLMTGGTTASDKDNEWEKYIVGSTLGGLITAGDNLVWNWSGVYTVASTTGNTSANRVGRGNSAVSYYASGIASSTATNATGFRPVLLIEILADFDKTFIYFNGEYKKFNEGKPATLGANLSPVMTSNTAPSPYVTSASTELGSGVQAWEAFSGGASGNFWRASVSTGWLQIDFGVSKKIVAFEVHNDNASSGGNPKNIQLLASNTGSFSGEQVTLYENTNISMHQIYTIPQPDSYRYYRLNVLANNGSTYAEVSDLKLYGEGTPETLPSWQMISSTLPTKDQFITNGMEDLSIFDRKIQTLTLPMDDNTVGGSVLGDGKVFKERIDLTKFFDLRSLNIK